MHPFIAVAIVTLFGATALAQGQRPLPPAEKPLSEPAANPAESEKVKLEFYVMSQCPFAIQVENAVIPVLKKMGPGVEFSLDFIGSERDGQMTSLHGENEVAANKIQICAARYSPGQYLDLISCMNENYRDMPGNFENCARTVGAAKEPIKACANGPEGRNLLTASFAKSSSRRALGSPTMFINGKPFTGNRSEAAFGRALCAAFVQNPPAYCASIPPPLNVPIVILTDSRCKECYADTWKTRLDSMFAGSQVRVVDWMSDEGKKMTKELGVKLLPVILFGAEVAQHESYSNISRHLTAKGPNWLLDIGARFDPTKEICDNNVDDNGNGKLDCADADCKNFLACRPEAPKKLEVFIMSQCPFAVKALNSMKPIMSAFGQDIRFEIHFIVDADGNGFRSLHGQAEVDENLRELCAIKHYPKNHKFMDYIHCRNQDIRSENWQTCTGNATGIAAEVISRCATGTEGPKLLRDDMQIAKDLGVSGSPTWLVNNKVKFSGIDSAVIQRNFCKSNLGLKGCNVELNQEKDEPAVPAENCNQ